MLVNMLQSNVGQTRDMITKYIVQNCKRLYTKGPESVKVVFHSDHIELIIAGYMLGFERILVREGNTRAEHELARMRQLVFNSERENVQKSFSELLGFKICATSPKLDYKNDVEVIDIYPNDSESCETCRKKYCCMNLIEDIAENLDKYS